MISEGSCDTEDWSNGAEIYLPSGALRFRVTLVIFPVKSDRTPKN